MENKKEVEIMSKTFITTVDFLEQIFPFYCGNDVSKMVVFHKEKEMVSAKLVESMCLASNQGLLIQMLSYVTKEELMFRLGTILEKEKEYIISDGIFAIPDWLKNEYDISVDGAKTKSTKGKRTTKGVKNAEQKTAPEAKEFVEVLKQAEVEEGITSPTPEPTAEATKEETKEETKGAKSKKPRKTEKKDKKDENLAVEESAFDVELEGSLTAQEIEELETGFRHSADAIKEFLKRSGVRASDMLNCKMSDEELGDAILTVLEADTNKARIKDELAKLFGEYNSTTISQWINPQITKLHELAIR